MGDSDSLRADMAVSDAFNRLRAGTMSQITAYVASRVDGLADEEKSVFLNEWDNTCTSQIAKSEKGVVDAAVRLSLSKYIILDTEEADRVALLALAKDLAWYEMLRSVGRDKR